MGFRDHVLTVCGEVVHSLLAEPGEDYCVEGGETGVVVDGSSASEGKKKNKSREFGLIPECEGAPYC